ncbi:bifunctional lysylphosphatidylglycerol synthetase/lysine--tRNA ligase LysX [Actinomyces sp. 594]|uniref:bifunctional lysylphosphatidylglycerol synthetase/lysine--tRNA ligase LysX n=1 Tax=Actinomyces sp. 594 TaxID=2057793 RepID=UPI001C596D94|nr:bifunctional lysylphosphatidylglycerol synthetase/lysine--tRNA ligase LysX [Actinomyces sp. 594]MBW3070295.1 bifunctional lysylphosphatidylglycerol synthetase/lysine--tRNA ligase LysX [Actinomyces sp. 594]
MQAHKPLFPHILPRVLYLIAVLALTDTVLNSTPGIGQVLEFIFLWIVPLPSIDWLSGIVLLLLAAGMTKRKRAAWTALTLVTALVTLLYVLILAVAFQDEELADVRPYLTVNTATLLVFLGLLTAYRRHYTVRSQPGNSRRALTVFVASAGSVTLAAALVKFAVSGVGARQFGELLVGGSPQWLASLLGFGWAITFLVAFGMLLRSQQEIAQMSVKEESRVRTLLAEHPADSLGYFATRRDKSALLTDDAAVVYRVANGVALASGDPLGEPSTWSAAARAFVRRAAEFGWTPAVIGVSEAGARAYADAGLRALHIGDEAVLDFSRTRIDDMPEVRRPVRRLKERGYTVRIRRHREIPTDELSALTGLAHEWLGGEAERGFSMALGRLGDPSDGECVMVEALYPPGDERGEIAALLSFAPWGADGLSLDVMRRHPGADNGVTELMVSALMSDGVELGLTRASLNFAVFRSAFVEGERIGAGPVRRLWRRLMLLASRWWQLESLYRSNAKYNPVWSPRMICYPDGGDLARVAFAMGVAEGFVSPPGWLSPTTDINQPRRDDEDSARLSAISMGASRTAPSRRPAKQFASRLASREAMVAAGMEPYPPSVNVTASCADASGACSVAGRVMSVRDHGGVLFADLRDRSGDLQILLERSTTGVDDMTRFRRLVRAGDQVVASGTVGTSRTGTRSLLVSTWSMTSKALRPLPDKRRGIRDPETRVRQRHLALIVDPGERRMVAARSHAIQAVRRELLGRDYLEVETPILQPVHGGANARPFKTHINAYDLDLYLRIAPELYLKRLLVGGMERVFEIGRNFRNEGADATHNPEFTMLEAYQAHADYEVMKDVARDLIVSAARAALGTTVIRGRVGGAEHEIDLAAPWRTVSVCEAVSEGLGEEVGPETPMEVLRAQADGIAMPYDPRWGWGTLMQELYEHLVESTTVAPTFFTDFPAETSPLTRPHRQDARLAERWDLIVFGAEVGTAYSELVDPVIQRQRLTDQSLAAAGGDPEAMELDEAFLAALEQGMPPSGGLGVGLDRLVMMLTGASIRETIAFPLVRPEQ